MNAQLPGEDAARRTMTAEAFAAWKANHPGATASERIRAARGHDETAGDPDHNRRADDLTVQYVNEEGKSGPAGSDFPFRATLGAGHVLAAGHDPDSCETCSPLLDQLASLARTALTDPGGLADELPHAEWFGPRIVQANEAEYVVCQLDRLINTLNPSELTPATMRRALVVLGRQLAAVLDQAEAEGLLETDRSLIGDSIRAALDHLDQAIAAVGDQS